MELLALAHIAINFAFRYAIGMLPGIRHKILGLFCERNFENRIAQRIAESTRTTLVPALYPGFLAEYASRVVLPCAQRLKTCPAGERRG
jgi:hypothetical protein